MADKLAVELLREKKQANIDDKVIDYVEYSILVNGIRVYVKGADKTSKGVLELLFNNK